MQGLLKRIFWVVPHLSALFRDWEGQRGSLTRVGKNSLADWMECLEPIRKPLPPNPSPPERGAGARYSDGCFAPGLEANEGHERRPANLQPEVRGDSERAREPVEAVRGAEGVEEEEPRLTGFAPREMQATLLLTVSRPAMACEFEVLLNQFQYSQATDAALLALRMIEDLENLFSVYKPRSELSTLNRFGSQRAVAASHDTLQLLRLAKAAKQWTNSAFDITAGSLSEVWGFSRRTGRKPSDEEIAAALEKVGSDHILIDEERGTVALGREGVTVNPGGIGKGYALDRAASRLVERGVHDFMIHGGLSSILARGQRQHPDASSGWQISLKHPWRWNEHLGTICLQDGALATSGSGKQFFHFGGKRFSHIIDPRTGWPAQGMMSATVLCASAAIADVLATAFFVMGIDASREFCSEHSQVAAIFVHQDEKTGKQVVETANLRSDIWQPR